MSVISRLAGVDCVVWDFDGVLNANIDEGRFLWSRDFERDTGQSLEKFQAMIFSSRFEDVLRGRLDLRDHVAAWADQVGYDAGADALIDYWFKHDAWPDGRMVRIMDAVARTGCRQVIATNNEPRRTAYIDTEMGFGARVERILSSGRLGHVKPERAYFETVCTTLGLPAERLLLVDDSATNIRAAMALGWQGHLFRHRDHAGLESRLGLARGD